MDVKMEYLVTAREMKHYDEVTVRQTGIPAPVLMERAALSVLEELTALSLVREGSRALILAGNGNNGGDGLALARLLCERNVETEVVFAGEPSRAAEGFLLQRHILTSFPVKIGRKPQRDEYTILVDALFGVGLSREITGEYAEWVEWFNRTRGFKVAIDVPSGVCSDTGRVLGVGIRADLTVSFAFGKRGLFFYPGCEYAGRVVIKDIGIGKAALLGQSPGMFRLTAAKQELLPVRAADGNKGTFGKVLLAAGSKNMAGAAVLAARGCYRMGAGMVKVLTPECNRMILQCSVPEALLDTWEECLSGKTQLKMTGEEERPSETLKEAFAWADVLAIGPGLSKSCEARELLSLFLQEEKPLVVDADGLNLLAEDRELMLTAAGRRAPLILTPHPGELSRLTGRSISQIRENPIEIAAGLAESLNCVIVSKDARTLTVKAGKPVCMNVSGNSGLATAGSGDVLTGMIAGLLAQGLDEFSAACRGVCLHGLLAEEAAVRYGEHGMSAISLVEQ